MSKTKWFMKQYWRVGQIRALTSLALGMLVLGKLYYVYVPTLQDMGFFGAVILGVFLIFVFMGLGWLYDQKARMWSQKTQAITERTVFQYVPNFRTLSGDYPIILITVHTIREILKKIGHGTEQFDEVVSLMEKYFSLKPVKSGIEGAQANAKKFWENKANQFSEEEIQTSEKTEWSSRIKLGFETQMLRLNWIQSLTGLLQDVLVFGALYVVVVFPGAPQELELILAILGISLPLLIVLLAAGWYYDKKLRVWSADTVVKLDRDPYSYVAEPYLFAMVLPFFYTYMHTLKGIMIKKEMNTREIDEYLNHLKAYCNLVVSNEDDFQEAFELRKALGELFKPMESRS